jgi:hypothetical protein
MFVEMAVKSMETAVEATTSMEMAPGALPRLGRVLEQRLLSPEIHRWRRQSCGTSFGKLPIDLGFSIGRLYIGGEAASEGCQGAHTPPPSVAAPWPLSGSPSVFVLHPGKIGGLAFVSSNFENISYVAFLKYKNSKKQGTSTVASR